MLEALRYDKGLGDNEIYARIPNDGQFWDFLALAWVDIETDNCRKMLAEFGDTSETQSWYHGEITLPNGGPWSLEILRLSTGETIGNDLVESTQPLAGALKCSAIIAVVSRQLQDLVNRAFPKAVLMKYLNYGVREIIDAKPEAGSTSGLIPLVPGTRQDIPAGWFRLLDAKRNMGADGVTPGRAIMSMPQAVIDSTIPDWHAWPPAAEVLYVITDDRDPLSFDVFPPQPQGTVQKIDALGVKYPPKALDPDTDGFPLTDNYEVPCVDYMIYRALYEATTIPGALNKSTLSLQKFYQNLGVKKVAEAKNTAEGQ